MDKPNMEESGTWEVDTSMEPITSAVITFKDSIGAEKALRVQEILNLITEYQEDLRAAEKYDSGPIMEKYKAEKEQYHDTPDGENMLSAIRSHHYELFSDINRLLEE